MKRLVVAIGLLSPVLIQAQLNEKGERVAYSQAVPESDFAIKMTPIPGGSFKWGATSSDKDKEADELPQHTIKIAPFWMGVYEVKYDEYVQFLNDLNFSHNTPADAVTRPSTPYIDFTVGMGKEGGYPANSMQVYAAIMYCKWLYAKTGVFYRLPTEAEWEYACRAGAKTIYPFGDKADKLDEYAWYSGNSDNKYQKVGLKKPNAWGLYDMLGNVNEWVLDQYDEAYYQQVKENTESPVNIPTVKHPRIVRGGSYKDDVAELRSSNRIPSDLVWNRRDPQIPKSRWWNADAPFVGFRLLRPAVQPSEEEINQFFATYLDL